jgi:hypothetical protein
MLGAEIRWPRTKRLSGRGVYGGEQTQLERQRRRKVRSQIDGAAVLGSACTGRTLAPKSALAGDPLTMAPEGAPEATSPMPEQLFAGVTEYPKLQGASSGLVGAAPVRVCETSMLAVV